MKKYLVAILLLFLPIVIMAQEVPEYMTKIFLNTISANGYVTKEIHDEFWKGLKSMGNEKEVIKILRSNIFGSPGSLEYQKECWESAKISYQHRKVVKTQRLIDLETNMRSQFADSITFPRNSSNYTSMITTFNKRFDEANEAKMLLLKSAAMHQSMIYGGQSIDINEKSINVILAKLNASFKRLDLLLTEEWNDNI